MNMNKQYEKPEIVSSGSLSKFEKDVHDLMIAWQDISQAITESLSDIVDNFYENFLKWENVVGVESRPKSYSENFRK